MSDEPEAQAHARLERLSRLPQLEVARVDSEPGQPRPSGCSIARW